MHLARGQRRAHPAAPSAVTLGLKPPTLREVSCLQPFPIASSPSSITPRQKLRFREVSSLQPSTRCRASSRCVVASRRQLIPAVRRGRSGRLGRVACNALSDEGRVRLRLHLPSAGRLQSVAARNSRGGERHLLVEEHSGDGCERCLDLRQKEHFCCGHHEDRRSWEVVRDVPLKTCCRAHKVVRSWVPLRSHAALPFRGGRANHNTSCFVRCRFR